MQIWTCRKDTGDGGTMTLDSTVQNFFSEENVGRALMTTVGYLAEWEHEGRRRCGDVFSVLVKTGLYTQYCFKEDCSLEIRKENNVYHPVSQNSFDVKTPEEPAAYLSYNLLQHVNYQGSIAMTIADIAENLAHCVMIPLEQRKAFLKGLMDHVIDTYCTNANTDSQYDLIRRSAINVKTWLETVSL